MKLALPTKLQAASVAAAGAAGAAFVAYIHSECGVSMKSFLTGAVIAVGSALLHLYQQPPTTSS